MTDTRTAEQAKIEAIVTASYPSTGSLINIAVNRASNATAANGWNATQYAWEIASFSPAEAESYWLSVMDEDKENDTNIARYEVAEALVAVGWDIHNVWRVLS